LTQKMRSTYLIIQITRDKIEVQRFLHNPEVSADVFFSIKKTSTLPMHWQDSNSWPRRSNLQASRTDNLQYHSSPLSKLWDRLCFTYLDKKKILCFLRV
jgi:hypothetical protein